MTDFHQPATFAGLAQATGADEHDIRALAHLWEVELVDGRVPYDRIIDFHDALNPHGERTVPEAFGYGGEDV